ncbi:phosphatase PAP2 family protein [Paenibacillus sp. FSL W8-0426]|uniref:acid phosphatase n=1 Tax=Paenibacillus sp. FSL W8-0426 TaxID=2921714 RepID=UPI0030DC4DFC
MKSLKKQATVALLAMPLLLSSVGAGYANAATGSFNVDPAPAPAWGYFVDNYKNNKTDNQTLESNPALGILSGFSDLWKTGDAWNTGSKLNESILDLNIRKVFNTYMRRTAEQAEKAYLDDRRSQSYSVIDGFGPYADTYRAKAKAETTVKEVAADATTTKYSDEGNGAGDAESSLGKVVSLVNTLRGEYSSGNPSKYYFQYPRPFRWVDNSLVVNTLLPVQSNEPEKDGGFPSGHTNAAYLTAFAFAYAAPERYQEMLTNAAELGESRVVAGMHSPLDVMGGRVLATALSAAILSDPANSELKQAAYEQAQRELMNTEVKGPDAYGDYDANKKKYTELLTFGFPQIDSKTEPMVVPKNAEVLLETRQPYLNDTQRREVLATTGLPSGYPLLNDPEGWGRLNLFAAADGYGAFMSDVTVNMDASKGGFNAEDLWRNDISGEGKLTKQGTGKLTLSGNNTYSGGTVLEEGTLEGASKTAFGTASVTNNGGTIGEEVEGRFVIGGDFKQSAKGTLELNISSKNDVFQVAKNATLGGKLQLNFTDGYVPANGATIMTFGQKAAGTKFASVDVSGLPSGVKASVVYKANSVVLKVSK